MSTQQSSESDQSKDKDEPEVKVTIAGMLADCNWLAAGARALGIGSLDLQQHILHLKAKLHQLHGASLQQTSIARFFCLLWGNGKAMEVEE